MCLTFLYGNSQNKISVVDGGGMACLNAYDNAYNASNVQYMSDIRGCLGNMAWIWYDVMKEGANPMNAWDAVSNMSCAWDALYRFYDNCDNAADSFAACSGVVIRG